MSQILLPRNSYLLAFLVGFGLLCPPLGALQSQNWQQKELPTRYWPEEVDFDPAIPSPKDVLGFEIGHRHLNHAQVVQYLQALAEQSDRVTIEQYGRTHGQRPLLMLTITAEKNRQQLDAIRRQHKQLTKPNRSSEVDIGDLPAVINMGYGVHGDESSATNCAPLVAHYLAAAKGEEIDRILESCVILLDPSLNPDGFNRFANWTNDYRGRVPNADGQHAEHNQNWPPGRVNYYWFDLNRDWLPVEHPESRGRLKQYHYWKPNVVLDFHEMGTKSTYFFQPGIPQRTNPFTPFKNVEFTNRFAAYHAKDLDKRGSLYFTQERFDDFYMGKGSTYPDLHGAVGILFEQASSRGHVQRNENGFLRFHETIANQFTTSLSSLRATADMRSELNDFKRDFYARAAAQAKASKIKTFVFSSPGNRTRLENFADVLCRHDIRCYWPEETLVVGDRSFAKDSTLIIPAAQPEFRFIKSLLMRRKSFKENVFYDVSSWTLPLAYDLNQTSILETVDVSQMRRAKLHERRSLDFKPEPEAVSYLVDWRDDDSVWVLNQLLKKNINVKVAKQSFVVDAQSTLTSYPMGTLQISLGIQPEKRASIEEVLAAGAERGVLISSTKSGLTSQGIDMGSSSFATIPHPKIAMPVAGGVSAYGAGEIWHLLDTRVGAAVAMLKSDRFETSDLSRYTTLLFPSGRYKSVSSERWQTIREWVEDGGTVVAVGASGKAIANAISGNWTADAGSGQVEISDLAGPNQLPFDSAAKTRALQLISGAIFKTKVDLTHPLLYGFSRKTMPVFRDHTTFLTPSENPYCNPMIYDSESPHLAGYCSDENLVKVRQSAAAVIYPLGDGRVVVIADNPNFRAFWHGTSRVFLNAIYFGHIMNP